MTRTPKASARQLVINRAIQYHQNHGDWPPYNYNDPETGLKIGARFASYKSGCRAVSVNERARLLAVDDGLSNLRTTDHKGRSVDGVPWSNAPSSPPSLSLISNNKLARATDEEGERRRKGKREKAGEGSLVFDTYLRFPSCHKTDTPTTDSPPSFGNFFSFDLKLICRKTLTHCL